MEQQTISHMKEKMMEHTEILAPAGSFETMKAAYRAGADAVYIGGEIFGARAYADNPDRDTLLEAIDYAHLHGRRLYLTVNTLLKNTEIEKQLIAYLTPFYEQGLDAVIVQDMGVLACIRDRFPGLAIHASTQMTVCGSAYGQWLGRRGVTRIVTPRELSLEEIADMKAAAGLEIETFVHGALCYCYSGQCLMSSMIGGRSGNRGRCAQPCRLPWQFDAHRKKDGAYLLSPKDLCSLERLPDIIEAGVDSLKIEGRMKKPEYAALTTALYRKYVDLYREKGRDGYAVDPGDVEQLMDLYNRGGFTDGYFDRHNGRKMISAARPNHSGLCVGTAEWSAKGEWLIRADRPLNPGDILELPDSVSMKVEHPVSGGGLLRLKKTGRLKTSVRSGPVMRTRNEKLIRSVTEAWIKKGDLKENIYGSVNISKDLPVTISLYHGRFSLTVQGADVSAAQNHPLSEDEVRRRLMKTGQTPFAFEKLDIQMEPDCYLSVQELNRLRREALAQLRDVCLQPFRRKLAQEETCTAVKPYSQNLFVKQRPSVPAIHVLVSTEAQLAAALDCPGVERIYYHHEGSKARILEASARVHSAGKAFYLAMPHILRKCSEDSCRQLPAVLSPGISDGFLIRNMETWLMLRSMGAAQPCVGDTSIYCMNDRAADVYGSQLDGLTLPLELNRRELANLRYAGSSEMLVYGYVPLMVSAQCILKTTGTCTGTPSIHRLEDRMHKHFPVRNVCAWCYNLIYNSVPLYLLDLMTDIRSYIGPSAVRLQFLDETESETAALLETCEEAMRGQMKAPMGGYTRGHYQRGIE